MIPSYPETSPPPPPRNDRLVALFLLGAIAFNPPLLRVLGQDTTILGLPVIGVALFSVWAVIILCIALDVEQRNSKDSGARG